MPTLVTDGAATVPFVESADRSLGLASRELDALRVAATWYAKYHASIIAEEADDESAYAVVRREEYLDLIAALAKLGVRIGVPERLAGLESHAA